MDTQTLLLSATRLPRWVENFGARHGGHTLASADDTLTGSAVDGSSFTARLPFERAYAGPPDVHAFVAAVEPPAKWGVLLVRKGGFAVARMSREQVIESKVGRRHVQGRSKAGGQSQQRFARRRDNQARQAYEAAADHAARILTGVPLVVAGGDREALAEVLGDRRLAHVAVIEPWLPVPDPRRSVLEGAIQDACSVKMTVVNS